MDTTTRTQLIETLSDLPAEIAAAETGYAQAVQAREREEARLILSGTITGKNEGERKAQLVASLLDHEDEVTRARIRLHEVQAQFAAARSVARLLAAAE